MIKLFSKTQDYIFRVIGTQVTVAIVTGITEVFAMAAVAVNLDKAKVR